MWLFTRHGFYSVVAHKDNPHRVLIRARLLTDLERLRKFVRECLAIELPAVVESCNSDYACRVTIDRTAWEQVARALARDVDYPNFKNEVHGESDRDDAYMRIWSVMRDLQRQQTRLHKHGR